MRKTYIRRERTDFVFLIKKCHVFNFSLSSSFFLSIRLCFFLLRLSVSRYSLSFSSSFLLTCYGQMSSLLSFALFIYYFMRSVRRQYRRHPFTVSCSYTHKYNRFFRSVLTQEDEEKRTRKHLSTFFFIYSYSTKFEKNPIESNVVRRFFFLYICT